MQWLTTFFIVCTSLLLMHPLPSYDISTTMGLLTCGTFWWWIVVSFSVIGYLPSLSPNLLHPILVVVIESILFLAHLRSVHHNWNGKGLIRVLG